MTVNGWMPYQKDRWAGYLKMAGEKNHGMSTGNYIADAIRSHFIRCTSVSCCAKKCLHLTMKVRPEGENATKKRRKNEKSTEQRGSCTDCIWLPVIPLCFCWLFSCEMASSFHIRSRRQNGSRLPVLHFESSILCWLCSCVCVLVIWFLLRFFFICRAAIQILRT